MHASMHTLYRCLFSSPSSLFSSSIADERWPRWRRQRWHSIPDHGCSLRRPPRRQPHRHVPQALPRADAGALPEGALPVGAVGSVHGSDLAASSDNYTSWAEHLGTVAARGKQPRKLSVWRERMPRCTGERPYPLIKLHVVAQLFE